MSSIADEDEDHSLRRNASDVERDDDHDLQQQEVFDSSEEDEDDDEEEIQKVRDGFIVDDEDDDRGEKRKKKHKRRHIERERETIEEDEGLLDEDDLDLVMENSGATSALKEKSKFKRLKKAPIEEPAKKNTDLNDFFSDDEEEEGEIDESLPSSKSQKSTGRTVIDELDDFIEDDEFSDLDEEQREEARQRRKQDRLKPTELSGIDSEKVDELYDIFGDGEDYAWALEGEDEEGDREDQSRPELKDIYEPEELKARMLTDNDKVIRDTDIPERFQELRKGIKEYELSPEDFLFEHQWISYKLNTEYFDKRDPNFDEDAFDKAVGDVLNFIAKNNLEVPFIFSHRRDYLLKTTIIGEGDDATTSVETLINESDIWRIIQLDIEFHALLEKKKQIDHLTDSLNVDDQILEDAISNVQNITDLQDIHDYLNFQYSAELKDLELKRSIKNSIYDKIRADKLYELVQAFGITVKNYAENITSESKLFVTKDHQLSPIDLADEICSDESSLYAKSAQAIEASKHYFAEEFYNNLKIRKHFRNIYTNYSTISIVLTESGRLKIDKNSPYADFKYAINRSINEFYSTPDLFLRMLEAEAAHLVEIKLEAVSQDQLFESLYSLIESDGQSDIASDWNIYRRSALLIATKKLFPLITLNIKETLRRECERLLFFEVRDTFLKKIDQAPYRPKRARAGFGDTPRVLALSPGNGSYGFDSIVGVLLHESGEISETYKIDENPFLPQERVAEDQLSFDKVFTDLVKDANPDVIAINGFNVKTNRLVPKLKELISYYQLENNGSPIEVIYVNDEVAARFQNSKRAADEFPDKSTLVRYVIALARYVQSPLLEYVSLGEDLSTLSIHEHQYLLPEDQLKQALDTVIVDIVNMVGVDINKCVTDSYLASLLPYISGLGDRKAFGLLRAVQQHPLFSRQALITNENIRIGSTIFLNCASFLRIPQNKQRDAVESGHDIEPITRLDDTRIHPEDYALAEKMAADALDLDEEQIEELRDARSGETVIDKLLKQGAHLLHSLILEDYSRQLEVSFGKRKRATLQMILEELQEPFLEIRGNFHILQAEEIFQTLTGENISNFYVGLVLPVYLKKVGRSDAKGETSTQIDCTATGAYDDPPFYDKFQVGQTVQAKILNVDYANFTAEISLAERDIKTPAIKKTFEKLPQKWDFNREKYDNDLEISKVVQSQKKIRYINHPGFQNFNVSQAQNYLASKERGAYVIRPSSKGFDHITITWKVDNNLYQNIDVVEHDKETEMSLGKSLTVENIRYSDLDEIIESHIGQLVNQINQMLNHEKFHSGSKDDVAKWLENFSKANPNKGAYAFALNHKRPGYFVLLFKTSATSELFSWNVRVVPGGFELFGYPYPSVSMLCNGFKTVLKSKATKAQTTRGGASNTYGTSANYGNTGYNNSGYGNGGGFNNSYNNGAGYGNSNYNNSSYGAPRY